MSQEDVYLFLKNNKGKWYKSKDISKALKISQGSITTSLKKLREHNLIDYKSTERKYQYQYRFKK
jgi:Mn-dependent DtxR family transcriptional regulator